MVNSDSVRSLTQEWTAGRLSRRDFLTRAAALGLSAPVIAGALAATVVEVHNTHHERRLYSLRPVETAAAHVASMDKDHYVSPFISMDARYTVRVQDRPDVLRIVIDETEAGVPLLQASVNLVRRPLSDRNLPHDRKRRGNCAR